MQHQEENLDGMDRVAEKHTQINHQDFLFFLKKRNIPTD